MVQNRRKVVCIRLLRQTIMLRWHFFVRLELLVLLLMLLELMKLLTVFALYLPKQSCGTKVSGTVCELAIFHVLGTQPLLPSLA